MRDINRKIKNESRNVGLFIIVGNAADFYYIYAEVMLGSQYLMFYDGFGKFREPPFEGLLLKNSRNGEGANESLPFFVWYFSSNSRHNECGNLLIKKIRNYSHEITKSYIN